MINEEVTFGLIANIDAQKLIKHADGFLRMAKAPIVNMSMICFKKTPGSLPMYVIKPDLSTCLLTQTFQNAFSNKLFSFGFDFFSMFVPDLLHEVELGVWKAVFTHLIRILYAAGNNSIQKLNWRWVSLYSMDSILTMFIAIGMFQHLAVVRSVSFIKMHQQ